MNEKKTLRICTTVKAIQRTTAAAIVPSLENSDVSKTAESRHHNTQQYPLYNRCTINALIPFMFQNYQKYVFFTKTSKLYPFRAVVVN